MLIGINGKLGHGKDTLAERIQELHAQGVLDLPGIPQRRAFADKLKRAVAALLMVDVDFLEKAKRDDTTLVQIRELRFRVSRVRGLRWTRHLPGFERIVSSQTTRSVMQRMGTEVGRAQFGENFWVDQCVADGLNHTDDVILVTDVRFPNEIARIRDNRGLMVRVNGPEVQDAEADSHSSEQVIPAHLIDIEVDNTVRGDGFRALDAQAVQVVTHAASQPPPPAEDRRAVVRPTRQVSGEMSLDSSRLPDPRNIYRGPADE